MTLPRFYTLWAINGSLDDRRLCDQLDQMRAFGFDGTVWHPRFYPGRPAYLGDEYMAALSRTILHAKSIGLDVWIYDEDGWPSGTVGVQLLRQHPGDAQQWADLVTGPPADSLGSFTRAGQRHRLARRIGAGVDYLNPGLGRHFIALSHERYRTGLDPAAFDHVSTFFCDEPEFGLGPRLRRPLAAGRLRWTPGLHGGTRDRCAHPPAAPWASTRGRQSRRPHTHDRAGDALPSTATSDEIPRHDSVSRLPPTT